MIPKDLFTTSKDLYAALLVFFDQHPELQPRPFFITGEVGDT
jgi:carboxypeptidase C (cathepsin A)